MGQTIRAAADYAVLKRVGRTQDYSVYVVKNKTTQEQCLLKIASDVRGNGLLDREAFLLRELREEIERRNAEHKHRNQTDQGLGYQRCFPRLVESCLVPEQGNRRVNIIAIFGAASMMDLVPIEQWRARERVRVDPKSSAWIMGRLLKIFTLTHPMGVAAGKIDGGNILVNPIEHHVVLFDWTRARHHEGPLPLEVAREEISQAARQVILALGGDPETGLLPESDQLLDSRYADRLKYFVDKRVSDPIAAGAGFYELLGTLWESGFHDFTTMPL